jgi:DNA repair exonuclease SbcCD nuclease subunit
MLKVLHAADIHLGAKFSGLGDKGISQREQVRATFKNIIATAINEKANIVLIAGDLFDANQQPQRNIDLVVEQFNLLGQSDIPVCLIPGNHDPFDSSSIYRKVNFEGKCPNLKIFTAENISYKEYPEIDLTVYGKPNLSNRSYVSPLEGLKQLTSTKFHIAMAHGSLYIPEKVADDDHVFKGEEIEASGMDYIALGHWHRAYACSEKPPAWYPGPPEWIPDQRERGSILLVTIFDHGEVKVEAKEVGLRNYDEIEIEMSEIRDSAELKEKTLEGADANLVRRATFKGLRDAGLLVNTEELESDLKERFFHLRLIDKSHPTLEEFSEEITGDHSIKSEFIRLMRETIESSEGEERNIAESAIQYGIALLENKEVL